MKKILPIVTPIVNTYTSYGTLFSIIPQDTIPWVVSNFIQLNYVEDWDMVTFDCHRMFLSNCPSISFYEMPREILLNGTQKSFKDIIVEAIDDGRYLFIYADRFYIPITPQYQKYHFQHEIFVYGYDLENNLVFVADNFRYGKFSFEKCGFSEFEEAFMNMSVDYPFMSTIRFLMVNENSQCRVNINQIIHGLDSYINSKESIDIVGPSNMKYGLSIYDYFGKNMKREEVILDIRFFHILYEHKLLMEMRLDFLIENGYVDENEFMVEQAKNLKQKSLILRNMVVKYCISPKKELYNNIYSKLINLKEEDCAFCETLLELLLNFRA